MNFQKTFFSKHTEFSFVMRGIGSLVWSKSKKWQKNKKKNQLQNA
jgi:hypothetical protein